MCSEILKKEEVKIFVFFIFLTVVFCQKNRKAVFIPKQLFSVLQIGHHEKHVFVVDDPAVRSVVEVLASRLDRHAARKKCYVLVFLTFEFCLFF